MLGIEFFVGFFSFIILMILIQCLLTFIISDQKSVVIFVHLYICVIFFSSLVVFKLFSSSLVLNNFIKICSDVIFFIFLVLGFIELSESVGLQFPSFGKILAITSSNIFLSSSLSSLFYRLQLHTH